MPMTAAGLKAAIKGELSSAFTISDDTQADKAAQAIANAVVSYIQANALVTLTAAVVTSGVGAGGTVTGTGTIS
jgi:hypothetical protein